MRFPSVLLLSLALGSALPSAAAVAHLLKDINPGRLPASSNPRFLGRVGAHAILVAEDELGAEPWVTDGTEGGTRRLIDLCPGLCGSAPQPFGRSREAVFFVASPASGTFELWATDGTPAGTRRILASPATFRRTDEIDLEKDPPGARLYFPGSDGVQAEELWVSDGTIAGTQPLSHLGLQPGEIAVRALVPLGAGVVFLSNEARGPALWGSDGTVAGTRRLLVPDPAAEPEEPEQLFRAGSAVYFTAKVGRLGRELWKTDGTPAGTVNVADLVRGPRSLEIGSGATLGNRLLFVAKTPQAGTELWITDGSRAGTRMLTHFDASIPFPVNGPLGALPALPAVDLGSRTLFIADDGVHGWELWGTDGTIGGTRLVRDILPGVQPGAGRMLTGAGGRAFLTATDGVHGVEVWSSDGTTGGTRMVRDLCRGACSAPLSGVLRVGSRVVLGIDRSTPSNAYIHELWRSDGTPAGTYRLAFDGPLVPSGEALALGSAVLFASGEPTLGRELWRSDLTQPGTHLLADIHAGLTGADSGVLAFLPHGTEALFLNRDGGSGLVTLWRSDGTEGGTQPFVPLGVELLVANVWAEAGGKTFFGLDNAVWRTDGTALGTFRLTPDGARFPDPRLGGFAALVAAGERVYFPFAGAEHGFELWTSDGTLAGTHPLVDLVTGAGSSRPSEPVSVAGSVFFTAEVPPFGRELWSTDGSVAGTRMVKDITPGVHASTSISDLVPLGGRLYFQVLSTFPAIWRSDGTEAGTVPVLQPSQFTAASGVFLGTAIGNRLRVFVQSTESGVAGTYLSDGTLPGTQRLAPAQPPVDEVMEINGKVLFTIEPKRQLRIASGTPGSSQPLLDRNGDEVQGLLFAGQLGSQGLLTPYQRDELWETDGTPAGTGKIESLEPRLLGFSRQLVVGEKLFILAFDHAHGVEPWVISTREP